LFWQASCVWREYGKKWPSGMAVGGEREGEGEGGEDESGRERIRKNKFCGDAMRHTRRSLVPKDAHTVTFVTSSPSRYKSTKQADIIFTIVTRQYRAHQHKVTKRDTLGNLFSLSKAPPQPR
jgi:hypothetical protein